jgi:hypothetical protein
MNNPIGLRKKTAVSRWRRQVYRRVVEIMPSLAQKMVTIIQSMRTRSSCPRT